MRATETSSHPSVTTRRRALVTGASSGIGAAFAAELTRRNHDVILVARDRARLDALAKELADEHRVTTEAWPADLTNPAELATIEARLASEPPIDVLVNNAGFGDYGPFAETSVDLVDSMVRLNVLAVTRLTHAAATAMLPRGSGAILNVSSVGGEQPVEGFAAYNATKAFVTSFSEAVHDELRGKGVHVTALCPGFTRSEFHSRGEMDVSGMPGFLWQDADDVARAGLDALERNRASYIPGLMNRAAVVSTRFVPRRAARKIAAVFVHRIS